LIKCVISLHTVGNTDRGLLTAYFGVKKTKPEPQYSSQAALTVLDVADGYKLVAVGQVEAAAISAAVFC
jgi:hypothetical protein